MKLVVIGGSGLIGSKVVRSLREQGHEVIAASPSTGINAITGEGLRDALEGTLVVVDVANSPSFEDRAVLEFFETSSRNLLAAEVEAGVGHHVALSIVGCDRIPDSGYMRAKVAQESLIRSASVPYSIVRATQFFEFVGPIISQFPGDDQSVRVPAALFQPIASDDVAAAIVEAALGQPVNSMTDIAGPDRMPFAEFVRQHNPAHNDLRQIQTDSHARYFGAELREDSLVPLGKAKYGEVRFEEWLSRQASAIAG